MRQKYRDILTQEVIDSIIDDYVNHNLSMKKLGEKYNIHSNNTISRILGDKKRTPGQAGKLAHKLYPDKFKHSEKTKAVMRDKRLSFMREHPEKTAWRTCKSNMSYPEQCFIKYINDRGLDKQHFIIREKSFYPYYVDFAFVDIKLAVEIDGSQHLTSTQSKTDKLKDELLLNEGWNVVRITANCVMKDWDKIDMIFSKEFPIKEKITKVGVYKQRKEYVKKERGEDGKTTLQREFHLRERKYERPSKEELKNLIENKSYCEVGRIYGVSDNTIRKWCKGYDLYVSKRK